MGGNYNRGNNDLFAKTKCTADPEAYLDWELVVPEYRVRLATSEFTSFALLWWNDLCNTGNAAAVPPT